MKEIRLPSLHVRKAVWSDFYNGLLAIGETSLDVITFYGGGVRHSQLIRDIPVFDAEEYIDLIGTNGNIAIGTCKDIYE
jgi:hypothetical protein